jgi:hypothetical protein
VDNDHNEGSLDGRMLFLTEFFHCNIDAILLQPGTVQTGGVIVIKSRDAKNVSRH